MQTKNKNGMLAALLVCAALSVAFAPNAAASETCEVNTQSHAALSIDTQESGSVSSEVDGWKAENVPARATLKVEPTNAGDTDLMVRVFREAAGGQCSPIYAGPAADSIQLLAGGTYYIEVERAPTNSATISYTIEVFSPPPL